MALEQAKKFIAEISTNETAQKLLKEVKAPAGSEEAVKAYQEIAVKLGYDASVEDLTTVIEGLKKKQAAETEKARKAGENVEMSDVELEQVAGGYCDDMLDAIEDAADVVSKCDDVLNITKESAKKVICGVILWG